MTISPERLGHSPAQQSERTASILLVDDNPANLLSLRSILEDLGQNLVEARSGHEALARLRQEEFAVVLLDVQMPGLDGFETAKRIREDNSRHIPIIFLTAFESDRFTVEEAYSLGAVDYLVKPLVPVILRAKVAGFVELFEKSQQIREQAERLHQVERQRFDRSVDEQREWFRVTLASIGDAVITTDTHGLVTFLNPVARDLTGWTEAEAKGRPLETVFQIFHEQTRERVETPVAKVLKEGRVVGLGNHTVLEAKDGSVRPIDDSAAPIRDSSGALLGVVLIFRDVTEQRRAEHELRSSEARKSAILETALDCIVTIDHEGKVIEFNPAAEKTFGYSREQVIGRELAGFIIPPSLRDRHQQGMSHYLTTGEGPVLGRRLELPALRADGTEFPVELAITRISTDGPPLFTAYLRDIAEQKRAEQHRNARLAVTHALSEAVRIDEGARGVLRAVCENLGWEVGFFWTVHEDKSVLVCRESWQRPDTQATEFEEASCSRTFERGEGLPGRVWTEGRPAWILDIDRDGNFPRLASAVRSGLHSAFACPVVVAGRTLGVIEFFTGRIREPDPELLEMMETIAGNVGQFIERKTAEEELRRSEQELSDFFENATVGLHWVGPDGTILRANQAELDMLGYSREEYVGRPIAEFHADEDVICDILERLQSGEKLAEYPARLRCSDGSLKDVLIDSSVLWKDGRFVHTRCFTRDVTERKRAEAELARLTAAAEQQRRIYETVLSNTADFNYVFDLQGRFVYINRALLDLWGKPLHEAVGRNFFELDYPPDLAERLQRQIQTVIETRRPLTDQTPYTSALGERQYEYIFVPVQAADGSVEAVAGSTRDITEHKLAEQALRDADRRKDEFLATLAHELRNPLAPLRNALQVLNMSRVDERTAQQVREMMERQVDQLVRLVDDLLDVSRVMRGKIELRREKVELASVVARAVETAQPLIEVQQHTLDISLPPESLLLDADPVRMAQVVGNLLTNAAKYTDTNGRIRLNAAREGNEAVLRVRDNGIGIAPDMLPHVFDLFVQADHATTKAQGGLGIGLTLVKNLVEMHNGTVEAHSAGLGQGCEFTVRLPLVVEMIREPVRPEAEGERRQILRSGHRLMVVDDNRDAAMCLSMLLRLQGHDVQMAHDGPTALDLALSFRPHLVFLDIGMPKMDGYEVARRLRQTAGLEDVILAALTGWGQEEDRRRTAEAGFNHHLVKPPEPSHLDGVLADLKRAES